MEGRKYQLFAKPIPTGEDFTKLHQLWNVYKRQCRDNKLTVELTEWKHVESLYRTSAKDYWAKFQSKQRARYAGLCSPEDIATYLATFANTLCPMAKDFELELAEFWDSMRASAPSEEEADLALDKAWEKLTGNEYIGMTHLKPYARTTSVHTSGPSCGLCGQKQSRTSTPVGSGIISNWRCGHGASKPRF